MIETRNGEYQVRKRTTPLVSQAPVVQEQSSTEQSELTNRDLLERLYHLLESSDDDENGSTTQTHDVEPIQDTAEPEHDDHNDSGADSNIAHDDATELSPPMSVPYRHRRRVMF